MMDNFDQMKKVQKISCFIISFEHLNIGGPDNK